MHAEAPLIERLSAEPQQFALYRAIQLLEKLRREAEPEPADDHALPVRFSAHQSLAFPGHEIHRLAPPAMGASAAGEPAADEPATHAEVTLNAMTLTGPAGALPQSYTESAIRSLRDRAPGLAAFLDLFNDRIATLAFEAWRRYRLPALYERHGAAGGDAASAAQYAVAGFGTPHLRGRLAVPDEVLLFYAGLFNQQPRSAISLERMLADASGLPVRIEQFSGRWVAIPAEEQSALVAGGPAYNRLGVDTVAGARVWDVQGQFRIVLGPLTRRQFLDHLPGRPGLQRLVALAQIYAGPDLGFDVQLILRRDEVPDCTLTAEAEDAPRLGYDTWLAALPLLHDPADTILDAKHID